MTAPDPLAVEISQLDEVQRIIPDSLTLNLALKIIREQQRRLEVAKEALQNLLPLHTAPHMFNGGFQEEKERRFNDAKQALATLEGL